MQLTHAQAIEAGAYFAFIKANESDVSLLHEGSFPLGFRNSNLITVDPPCSVQDFEVSPDGQRLFCTFKDPSRRPDDVVLALCDASGAVRRFEGYSQVFASWLQGGQHLLVRGHSSSGHASLALVDARSGELSELEKPADLLFKHDLYDPEYLLSFNKLNYNERAVQYLDRQGQDVELFREKYEIRELRFSPDRTKVAYFYSYTYYKWIQGWRVVVVDVNTQGKTTVFDGVAESFFRLRWSPDSRGLAFICTIAGIPNNRLMDMDRYETMGGYAPDLMGNTNVVFSMKMDGSDRHEVVRDCWRFDWIQIPEFQPVVLGA